MTIRYCDFEGGNDANSGANFALRKKTLTSASSGLTGGDEVRIMASPDATSMGQDATFTIDSDTITLNTPVTENINTCEAAWTASANVTATAQSTTYREGSNAASLAIAAGFTTGKVAYAATAAANYAAYQQVSFLIRASTAQAASRFTLSLCSDGVGAVPVNTVAIPALAANIWTSVTVDTAGALGASIASVALNALADPGTVTVFLDNIIACKASSAADSLTHRSLISKNTGNEPWMALDSINGTTLKLGGGYQTTASRAGFTPYYRGATATQEIFKRECINLAVTETLGASGTSQQNPLNIEGGYDRTSMSSQNSQTYLRAADPNNSVIASNTRSAFFLDRIHAVNVGSTNQAAIQGSDGIVLGEVSAIASYYGYWHYQGAAWLGLSSSKREVIHCSIGFIISGGTGSGPQESRLRFQRMWGCWPSFQSAAVSDQSTSSPLEAKFLMLGADIQGFGYVFDGPSLKIGSFLRAIFRGCGLNNISQSITDSTSPLDAIFDGCTIDPSVVLAVHSGSYLRFRNRGGDPTDHLTYLGQYVGSGGAGGSLDYYKSNSSIRHTASDFSWELNAGSIGNRYRCCRMPLVQVACDAGVARTVYAWVRRNHASLTFGISVIGGYVDGVDDAWTDMTAAVNTWEQISITFTPTESGVVQVYAHAYNGSGVTRQGFIDDVTIDVP